MRGAIAILYSSLMGILIDVATSQSPSDQEVQVGQHVIYSYPGEDPPDHLFELIAAGKVGGVILFGENISDKVPGYIDQFQSTYRNSSAYLGTPLLIMTDQEGGDIRRLPGGPDSSNKQVGASRNPTTAARAQATDAFNALETYRMNVNLAPVVDVYRQEGDLMDQWERSYSSNATIAAECTYEYVETLQTTNHMQATAKHFPGLGAAAANENTDAVPVTLDVPLKTLRAVDELPYIQAIKAGVTFVMTSWAVYPAMDADRPAGLSSKWIAELRQRLGFEGAIITDAIEAGALEAFGSDDNRAVLAIEAGADIILAAARDVTQGESIVSALSAALDDGTLSNDAFVESSARVQTARKRAQALVFSE